MNFFSMKRKRASRYLRFVNTATGVVHDGCLYYDTKHKGWLWRCGSATSNDVYVDEAFATVALKEHLRGDAFKWEIVHDGPRPFKEDND